MTQNSDFPRSYYGKSIGLYHSRNMLGDAGFFQGNDMKFILDNLAIGDYQSAIEPEHDITALLNVANERDLTVTPLAYYKIPIIDMEPIPPDQLKEAVGWINERIDSQKILVFCNAGVGRSPSVVVAYLCCIQKLGFGQAVEYVATRKPNMSILPKLITSIEKIRDKF